MDPRIKVHVFRLVLQGLKKICYKIGLVKEVYKEHDVCLIRLYL